MWKGWVKRRRNPRHVDVHDHQVGDEADGARVKVEVVRALHLVGQLEEPAKRGNMRCEAGWREGWEGAGQASAAKRLHGEARRWRGTVRRQVKGGRGGALRVLLGVDVAQEDALREEDGPLLRDLVDRDVIVAVPVEVGEERLLRRTEMVRRKRASGGWVGRSSAGRAGGLGERAVAAVTCSAISSCLSGRSQNLMSVCSVVSKA